jgi:hypothetical protein
MNARSGYKPKTEHFLSGHTTIDILPILKNPLQKKSKTP